MKVKSSSVTQDEPGKPKSRCRRWRLVANTEQGRKFRRFTGTYTQAQEALAAWASEMEGFVPNADTFGAYAESWRLYRERSGEFTANTMAKDARNVRALSRSPLGDARMDSLGPADCREALLWMKANPEGGTRSGTLSNTTLRSLYVAMNSILQQAADDGLIAANPCAKVKPPKEDTDEKRALSKRELSDLLDKLDGMPVDAHVMALYLMACVGLRRGEALALLDSDVSGGECRVHLSVNEASGEVGAPKSDSGVRVLPAPSRLLRKVDEWRDARASLGLSDAETLCCNVEGGVMRPQNMYKWWVVHRDELDCADVTLHQLRHSNLTMMARRMSPFDLQRWAGWSSVEPAKVYVHADKSALERAVDGLEL